MTLGARPNSVAPLAASFSGFRASRGAQLVKNLASVQETQVQSLGWEDLLEKEMAMHSSILAWKTPWTEEPDGLYSPWHHKELDTTE